MCALVVRRMGTALVSTACLLLLACSSQAPQGSPGGSGGSAGSDAGSPVDGITIDEGYLSCPGNCGITSHPPTRRAPPSDCTFDLETVPPVPDNIRVQGRVNAVLVTVPQGDPDGWLYEPGFMAITLDGASCRQVRDGTLTDLRVLFGCPSCPIP